MDEPITWESWKTIANMKMLRCNGVNGRDDFLQNARSFFFAEDGYSDLGKMVDKVIKMLSKESKDIKNNVKIYLMTDRPTYCIVIGKGDNILSVRFHLDSDIEVEWENKSRTEQETRQTATTQENSQLALIIEILRRSERLIERLSETALVIKQFFERIFTKRENKTEDSTHSEFDEVWREVSTQDNGSHS